MMKKLLFTAAIAAFATAAFPQHKAVRLGQQPNKAAQKSVYYLKPAGVPFEVYTKDGQMSGTTYLYVPGYYETKFTRVAPEGTETFWHQNAYDMYGNCTSYDRTGQEGLLYSSDSEGNFYLKCRMNSANALPTIVCATDSFTLSEENPHWGELNYDLPATMMWYPQIKSGTLYEKESHMRPLQFTDDKVNNYSLGGMDNGYLFGTGTISGGQYTVSGLQQVLEKPVAPLWVADSYLTFVSKSSAPMPEGTSLKMLITNVETNAQGVKVPGSEVIAELECTPSDLVEQEGLVDEYGTNYYQFSAVFKGEDEGFLIDQEFAVVIRGLDQAGLDMGFSGAEIPYYNNELQPALCTLTSGNAANIYGDNRIALNVAFTAKFDYANAYVDYTEGDTYNFGVVLMDDAGTSGHTIAAEDLEFKGAAVLTNGVWYDENENEQYTLSGMPDWVKSYEVDEASFKYAGLTVIAFTCSPLPADVKGRSCDILIHGKGVTSDKPITVVQGDVKAAIESAKAEKNAEDAPMYNVAGQRVDKNYKGVVIQNGMKRINK